MKNFSQIVSEKGYNMSQLSKQTGISEALLSYYKKGLKTPSIKNVILIANCLNCSIDYLVGRTDVDYWPQVAASSVEPRREDASTAF